MGSRRKVKAPKTFFLRFKVWTGVRWKKTSQLSARATKRNIFAAVRKFHKEVDGKAWVLFSKATATMYAKDNEREAA